MTSLLNDPIKRIFLLLFQSFIFDDEGFPVLLLDDLFVERQTEVPREVFGFHCNVVVIVQVLIAVVLNQGAAETLGAVKSSRGAAN